MGLQAWDFRAGSGRAPRTRHRSERRQSRQRGPTAWKQPPEAHPGTRRQVTRSFQSVSRRGSILRETPLGTKDWWPVPFPCRLAQGKYRATGRNRGSANTRHLICLHPAPPTLCCRRTARPGRACLSPSRRAPPPPPTRTNSCRHRGSPSGSRVRPWFQQQQVPSHKLTRAHLVKTQHSQARDQTLPTTGKPSLCRRWRRTKWPGHGRAHPGHAPRSGRPWGTGDTAWQGTVAPLLQKAIPLKKRRQS